MSKENRTDDDDVPNTFTGVGDADLCSKNEVDLDEKAELAEAKDDEDEL